MTFIILFTRKNNKDIINQGCEVLMKINNKTGSLAFIIGVITSVITVMSLAVAIFALFDRKKKKEDKELQDYLDTSIN